MCNLSGVFLRRLGLSALALLSLTGTSRALTFNFTPIAGTSQQAIDGFTAAGARWSALFTDNVTVNLTIGFSALSPGVLAQAGSTQAQYAYTNVRSALIADATSATDALAIANLPNRNGGTSFGVMTNRTTDNPNGANSATPFLDITGTNTTTVRMSNANAKALGLLAANNAATDASITFSTLFTWDFDPSNGISSGDYDFIGIATHEIGHSLGFISGVDVLDANPTGFSSDAFRVSTLDLFRRSALSVANGGNDTIDWVSDNTNKYFSLDGGTTNLGLFSNGSSLGDGQQASHWKDNLGLGVMDPTAGTGELLTITARDIQAFDAIGWTQAVATSAPEPGTLALALLGLPAFVALRRRKA